MRIVVIDGMGGGLGKALIERIRAELPQAEVVAVGTNAMATMAMLKAGAHIAATGENAVIVNTQRADYILGAMGIAVANALHGEISPAMALAVCTSQAHKVLLPIDKCNVTIAGVAPAPAQQYVAQAVAHVREGADPGK